MESFTTLQSTCLPFLQDDIDTDQIIPARFLTGTTKTGLGTKLFYDWRYDADGRTLAGERSGRRIAIGDRVRVQIAGVDITRRKLDLVLVEHKSAPRMRRSAEQRPEKRSRGPTQRRRGKGRSLDTKQKKGRGGGKRRRR